MRSRLTLETPQLPSAVPTSWCRQNTVSVYVGASNLGGSTLGLGGPGRYGGSGVTQAWFDTVAGRGQAGALLVTPSDYGPWGGSLAVSSPATWYFDSDPSTVEIFTGQNESYSVAVHELGHLFGIGTADSWMSLSSSTLTGAHSDTVTVLGDGSHWAEGTMSTIAGTAIAQEAAMDPTLTTGTRKYFTTLDYDGLRDIGWQVSAIPEASALAWAAALGASACQGASELNATGPTGGSSRRMACEP